MNRLDINIITSIAEKFGYSTIHVTRGNAVPDIIFEKGEYFTTAHHAINDLQTVQEWTSFFEKLNRGV